MTDINITIVSVIVGMLLVFFFIGIGVILSDVRHYFVTKGTTERGCVCDNGTDTVLCRRHCDRGGDNGCFEQMDSETLATYIRTMISTGICPSNTEKQCLEEAASRIERSKA